MYNRTIKRTTTDKSTKTTTTVMYTIKTTTDMNEIKTTSDMYKNICNSVKNNSKKEKGKHFCFNICKLNMWPF